MECGNETNGHTDSEVIWMIETARWFTMRDPSDVSIREMLNGEVSIERINRLSKEARTEEELEKRPQWSN